MSILFVHRDDTRSITELSSIVHNNRTHPYISSGVTIKKVQSGDHRINTANVGGSVDSLDNWVRIVMSPPQQQQQHIPQSYVQRQPQPVPQTQHPAYSQDSPPHARPTTANSNKPKSPYNYTRGGAIQKPAHVPVPPPVVGKVSMASVFASQLTGNRGDEEGFSARDANFIANLMCETTTIGANQI